jgi:hypothetical protein
MRTSDVTVVACMEMMHQALVDLRELAAFEVVDGGKLESNYRPLMSEIAGTYLSILTCLIDDVGDDATDLTVRKHATLGVQWDKQMSQARTKLPALVDDATKMRVFRFLVEVLKRVHDYVSTGNSSNAEELYSEMDRAHNVPREVYSEQQSTRYGNLIKGR